MSVPASPLSPPPESTADPVPYLRSIYAVRQRSQRLMTEAAEAHLNHFDLDLSKLDDVASYVADVTKRDYAPNYASIPPHGRWQHFDVGGVARVDRLLETWSDCDDMEKTRRLLDLFLVSVLLDAGAGNSWSYKTIDGNVFNRSEGLAVASLDMFMSGLFSSERDQLCRVDVNGLKQLSVERIGKALQVSEDNPMEGLNGRAEVLVRLGAALENKEFFGDEGRPGNMLDYLMTHPTTQQLDGHPAVLLPTLWDCLMDGLTPIWPSSRIKINNTSLGDAWSLSTLGSSQPANIIPFHKLTQWLCYSLMTPMTRLLGIQFMGAELMTGLAEYRNGGLLVDLGLLRLRAIDVQRGLEHPSVPSSTGLPSVEAVPTFDPDDEVIVEWRGLTVGFLDLLLPRVNDLLGLDDSSAERKRLSLAQMLEAGTWKCGREIAAKRRPQTKGPPLGVVSDGTVF